MARTVTAVVLGHGDRAAVDGMVKQMRAQTVPPAEVIVCVCCMDAAGIDADLVVIDQHEDDVGQRLCDYGLRLATADAVMFANSDDDYDPRFVEVLSGHQDHLVHCDYVSHLHAEPVVESRPAVGHITRGSFLVDRPLAQRVGYRHRVYEADGLFIEDLVRVGATTHRVPLVLYRHR
jgi:hypothetical protein